jgi:hypothetical protein
MFPNIADLSLLRLPPALKAGSVLLLVLLAAFAVWQSSWGEGWQPRTPGNAGAKAPEEETLDIEAGHRRGCGDPPEVSLVRLIAIPKRYNNQRIAVEGYLVVEFEGTGIYLSKQDADHFITTNGFSVTFDKTKIPFDGPHGPLRFANRYVHLVGTFRVEEGGPWQGGINNVDTVRVLPDVGDKRERKTREALKSAGAAAKPQGGENTGK